MAELSRATDEAEAQGTCVRALVVINPGNPTSQQLNEATMTEIVRFCETRGMVLMADEVYQENMYVVGGLVFCCFWRGWLALLFRTVVSFLHRVSIHGHLLLYTSTTPFPSFPIKAENVFCLVALQYVARTVELIIWQR